MNENLRRLRKEATYQVSGHGAFGEVERYQELDVSAFAHLIIKECAEIALREEHDPSDCILKHFGVER